MFIIIDDVLCYDVKKELRRMLTIKDVCKQYHTGELTQTALDHVSLCLRDNEFVAILGPSGSGKTTLLNVIGGLDQYDSGDLIINGVSTKQYKDKDWDSYRNHTIGFIFQSYNLIPHQTILANVELALTISGVSREERTRRAQEALSQVGLKEQSHKLPYQLSGGQMQRVAIARALVNDPDILLADEPTGALDSETSIQVMDLLKQVAKEKLVVMVTHNPELAHMYANRIVNLKDGVIVSDSNPVSFKEEKPVHKNLGKTSMNFLTALMLSFNNLKTKKARTILTSFAGSIGIIGIALILSISTGVNAYISSIEKETLSEYPLSIQSTGIDMSAMMGEPVKKNNSEVKVVDMMENMFSKIGSNDLKNLKAYIEEHKEINNYARAVEYDYGISPQIYANDQYGIRQVNPDATMKKLGMGTSSNSMMSSMMNTNVFYSLPSHASLYDDQYNIKAGHWPKNKNECVLVLSKKGGISDFMLYTLGLRDPAQLDQMLKAFSEEKNIKVTTGKQGYRYKDLLGITFKVVNASSYYQYDDTYKVYKDKSNDTNYINSLVQNGSDLKIVGVVQPKESTNASMLAMGIYYPYSLATSAIKDASNSQIVKAQLENKNINVITGQSFNDQSQKSFDLSSMFQVDNNALKNAFQFDTSKINISMPQMDMSSILSQIKIDISQSDVSLFMSTISSGYNDYLKEHPLKEAENLNEVVQKYLQSKRASDIIKKGFDDAIKENGEIKITEEQMQKIMKNVADDFSDYAKEDINSFTLGLENSMMNYLNSQDSKQVINQFINKVIKDNHLEEQLNAIMAGYMQNVTKQLSTSLSQAFTFNPDIFKQAIKMNRDSTDMTELMKSMMNTEQTSYDNNLKKFGYCDFDNPNSISIFPQDFEKKQSVLNYLDHYNEKMKKIDEDKVITYTDVVGTLMSSVTDIIDVISYVLIAFVGISLVVSSIMIGVITYISVLERKKEIGILRAIGASKHNISQVFNAETFIIGLLSGLMGIGITLLLLIPTNIIIHNVSNQTSINAMLPVGGAVVLILLSIGLTLLGGLIPSRKAAKEDPVKALRTD